LPLDVMLAVLLGAALHAGWNALVKSGSDRFLDTVLVVTGAAIVAALILPFLPLPASRCHPYLVASMLIHIAYYTLLAMAYHRGDLSLVYPLMRGTVPAITAVTAAILLGEWPGWGGWLGVFLISGGVLLLAADSHRTAGSRRSAILVALLNAGLVVVFTVVDGVGARRSGNAFSYTGWMLFFTGLILFGIALGTRRRTLIRHGLRNWWKGLLGGSGTLASYSLALWAMTHADIALVSALRETSIVFGTLIAAFVLRERITRWRFISIATVTLGAVAIKVL